jgi:hypothetical protein
MFFWIGGRRTEYHITASVVGLRLAPQNHEYQTSSEDERRNEW